MRSTLLCGLVAFACSVTLGFADDKVDLGNLPAPVQRTIKEWKGEGEVKKVKTRRLDGRTVYEVDYKQGGDDKRILVNADGSVVGDEPDTPKGKGKAKGKGKGKAKGHDKDRPDGGEEGDEPEVTPSSPAPRTSPSQAPTATPAPAPSTTAPAQAPQPRAPDNASATAPARNEAEVKAEMSSRIRSINLLGNSATAARAGIAAVSRETGVPAKTLEQQRQTYKIGLSGLLIAHEISKTTRKPANSYLKQHASGTAWERIADQTSFDITTLLPKLDRVQKAMAATQPKKGF